MLGPCHLMSHYIATWSPLTSDPELLNQLMYDLGVKRDVLLQDVLEFETDLNDAVALIIIYPESKIDEEKKGIEEQQREHIHSEALGIRCFIRQNIDNACGLIAVVNAVLNSSAHVFIEHGSILESISQRRSIQVTNEMMTIYNKAVVEDDSDSSIEHHFTVLTEVQVKKSNEGLKSYIVELDGERQSPFIRASSKGSGLSNTSIVRSIFDMLRKDTSSAAIYKLILVD